MWGPDGEGFEGGEDQLFFLEKKIVISLRKARLMCYEKVPGQLSARPNLCVA